MPRSFPTFLLALSLAASSASAAVDGSYAGRLKLRHPVAESNAAAVLSDAGGAMSGTVVLESDDPTIAGSYLVQGKHKGKHVRLRGVSATGTRLRYRANVSGDTLRGAIRLRGAATGRKGRLDLTGLSSGGESSCDAVFVDNEAFFTDQVMGGVLSPICAACHVPGGQAAATRLKVVAGDPAATAASTIALIDPASPGDSLLLAKPLARLPHGGGKQIDDGSPEAQALSAWADLVAQAECVGPPTPTTGPELYAAHCASCHGADASGLDGRPDVRCTVPSRVTNAVRKGRGDPTTGMPAFPAAQLSDAQLALIIDYLGTLCSGSAADLYASNCATCHGPTGGGGTNADGVHGPNIRCTDTGDFREKLAQGEEGMPAFPGLVDRAGDLASYVHTFCSGG